MGHGHSHGGHAHGISGRRALIGALVLNGVFLIVEAVVGWFTNSLALLSDAAHMASDVGALALALGALHLAQLSANNGRTFGLVRAEVLGAFLNGLTLAVACLWIAWEAVWRLSVGVPEVAAFPVLIVGGLGLLINLGSAWALHQSSADNLNLRAAMAHMLADALGSVGAIVAALLVGLGFPAADPILSVVIAVLVGASAWAILRDSSRVLLQLPPAEVDVAELTKTLLATAKVVDVHDVHVWTLDGKRIIVTAHLVVDKEAHLGTVCEAARGSLLKDFGVEHATLQTETSPCIQYGCGVTASA